MYEKESITQNIDNSNAAGKYSSRLFNSRCKIDRFFRYQAKRYFKYEVFKYEVLPKTRDA